MKYLLLVVFLAVLQAAPAAPSYTANDPSEPNQNAQGQTNPQKPISAPQSSSSIEAGTEKAYSDRDARTENEQGAIRITELPRVSIPKDWTDYTYWFFSLCLVVVGGLQIWLLWGTLGAIRRQADQMERQTEKLEKSIIVAESSANAANANIELVINKERARIFVEVDPLELPNNPILSHVVNYRVIFHGPTFAFVEDAVAEVSVNDSPIPPGSPSFGRISIPKVIPPGYPTQTCSALFFRVLDQFEIEQINHNRTFVHFRGFIRYKDFMERERETTFCYTWHPRESLNKSSDFSSDAGKVRRAGGGIRKS